MRIFAVPFIMLLALGEIVSECDAKSVVGRASFYKFGNRTANGEQFVPLGLTAAHRNLPFGTHLLVTNLKNGKSVIVRINDRGPSMQSRVLDLSLGAAKILDFDKLGIAEIRFEEISEPVPDGYVEE